MGLEDGVGGCGAMPQQQHPCPGHQLHLLLEGTVTRYQGIVDLVALHQPVGGTETKQQHTLCMAESCPRHVCALVRGVEASE